MPTDLQASMSRVPDGAVNFLPSTIKFTSAIWLKSLVGQHWNLFNRAFLLVRAGAAFQVVLKFFSEFLYEGDRGHRRGVAQRTEGAAQHVLCEVLHVIDIFSDSAAVVETNQRLLQPVRAFAAGNAPSATLMLVELHGAQGEFHNALGIVDHYHTAGAQHGASF